MARPLPPPMLAPGPFKVEHLPSKSEYELDNGHPIRCLPTRPRGGSAQLNGGLIIRTDPAVVRSGVEVGFDLGNDTLRAPDVSVLGPDTGDEWGQQAPPLAIEYADSGQDNADLKRKIGQLLAAGTLAVWVVRLTGPRRVEVHEAGGGPVRIVAANEELSLPGVLANPFPAAALFDPEQADRVALRNLLDRFGYVHPAAAREAGREEGREEGRLTALREVAVTLLRTAGAPDPEGRVAGLGAEALWELIVKPG